MTISGEEEVSSRRLAAYVLRNSGELPDVQWEPFAKAALSEPEGSGLKSALLTATVITAPGIVISSVLYQQVFKAFMHYKNMPDKGARMDIAAGLAEKGTADDLPVLIALLRNENPLGAGPDDADVRASAAYAILKMEKRLLATKVHLP
jgi:HEAT repeat protein